jgi:SAM-dependent methyltransferase
MAMGPDLKTSAYDGCADAYAAVVDAREEHGPDGDPFGIVPHLLPLVGDIAGLSVLDACCGEGYLARILAARGGRVTGIDISTRLIERARSKRYAAHITYRLADLSAPLPEYAASFDVIASYLALNDVEDYRGFASTLGAVLKPGGRAIIALNNPYAYVIRKQLGAAYFVSGITRPCGLAAQGVDVPLYHRTLPDYLDVFTKAGLQLTRLLDVDHPNSAQYRVPGQAVPREHELPYFMILAFVKPVGA